MNSLKLSIIVPIYNAENYLKECISSILLQSMSDFELILIDDGSTDNCSIICDEYAQLDNRIKVVHKKNEGQGVARKIGINMAKGRYIAFVDSDDWVEPNMYQLLCDSADTHVSDMVICDFAYNYEINNRVKNYSHSTILDPLTVYEEKEIQGSIRLKILLEDIHGYPWNKLYRRALLQKCNLSNTFGLENMQDWVLNVEYFSFVKRMMYVNVSLYNYRIHSGGSLRGKYKDYFSIIIKLHKYRMSSLAKLKNIDYENAKSMCEKRFVAMILYAAYEYELLFVGVSLNKRLKRINLLVNNEDVLAVVRKYAISNKVNENFINKAKADLILMRKPAFIYVFSLVLHIKGFLKIIKDKFMPHRLLQGS